MNSTAFLANLGYMNQGYNTAQMDQAKTQAYLDAQNAGGAGAKLLLSMDPTTKQVQPLGMVPSTAIPSGGAPMPPASRGVPMPKFTPPIQSYAPPMRGASSGPVMPPAPNTGAAAPVFRPMAPSPNLPPSLPPQAASSPPAPNGVPAPLRGAVQPPGTSVMMDPHSLMQAIYKSNPGISPGEAWDVYHNLTAGQQAQENAILKAQLGEQTNQTRLAAAKMMADARMHDSGSHYQNSFETVYQDAMAGKFGPQYKDPRNALNLAQQATRNMGNGIFVNADTGVAQPVKGAPEATQTMSRASASGKSMGEQVGKMFTNAVQAHQSIGVINSAIDQAINTAQSLAVKYGKYSPKSIAALAKAGQFPESPQSMSALNDALGSIHQATSAAVISGLRPFTQGTGQIRVAEIKQIENLLAYNPNISINQNIKNFQQAKVLAAKYEQEALASWQDAVQGKIGSSDTAAPPAPNSVSWNDYKPK